MTYRNRSISENWQLTDLRAGKPGEAVERGEPIPVKTLLLTSILRLIQWLLKGMEEQVLLSVEGVLVDD